MNNLPRLTLIFSVLFAVLLIGPALLSGPFGPFPLMKNGDVFDLLTPFILIPLYWLMLRAAGREPSVGQTLAFLVLTAAWVEGQGMHLSANSIGHLVGGAPDGGDAQRLTYFYDEKLSHYLWHAGIIGLSTLLLAVHGRRAGQDAPAGLAAPVVGGILHGLTYFITVTEAGTAPVGVPYAVAAALWGMIWGRGLLRRRPLVAFFVVAYLVAALLFAGWAIYWGGLPEFSQVGIIE
jgi:hypothetical protein